MLHERGWSGIRVVGHIYRRDEMPTAVKAGIPGERKGNFRQDFNEIRKMKQFAALICLEERKSCDAPPIGFQARERGWVEGNTTGQNFAISGGDSNKNGSCWVGVEQKLARTSAQLAIGKTDIT